MAEFSEDLIRISGAMSAGDFETAKVLSSRMKSFKKEASMICHKAIRAVLSGHAEAEGVLGEVLSLRGAAISDEYDGDLWDEAICRGGSRLLNMLCEAGLNPNYRYVGGATPLFLAARRGAPDDLLALLRHGAELEAIKDDGLNIIKKARFKSGMTENAYEKAGMTPLMESLRWSNLKNAECLLDMGASLSICDSMGRYPLNWLAAMNPNAIGKNEYLVLLRKMLVGGADVETMSEFKETPLSSVARKGCKEAVAILLEAGANIDRGERKSPLLAAAAAGNVETFAAVVRGGAKLERRDTLGMNAANVAASSVFVGGVDVLMEIERMGLGGWMRSQKTALGKNSPSALEYAAAKGRDEAVRYLVEKTPEYAQAALDSMPKKAERIGHAEILLSVGAILKTSFLRGADADFLDFAKRHAFRKKLQANMSGSKATKAARSKV